MKKVVALIGLYFFSLFLISCGGGDSGDSGVDFRVDFGIVEGSKITLTESILTVEATVLVRDSLVSTSITDEEDFNDPRFVPAHGVDVKFAIYQNQTGGRFETINSRTDASGVATALYRVGTNSGEDIIQAKAKGASAIIRIYVVDGNIVSTLISADPDNVDIGGLSTISVQGLNFLNLPVSGSQVDFSFLTNNSGARFINDVGQEVEELTKFLNIDGKTSVIYKGGNSLGMDIILVEFPTANISETINITVGPVDAEPPVITSTTLPSGTQNTSYGFQLRASNGVQPYTWRIINGSLPSGLSLNSTTGLISGIPRNVGWSSFNVEVEDAIGFKGLASLSLEIRSEEVEPSEPPVITSTTMPSGIENTLYGFQLRASGGTQPYTWQITSGDLPEELELNSSTGLISGVPNETGWFSFNVQVRDALGSRGFASLSLEIREES